MTWTGNQEAVLENKTADPGRERGDRAREHVTDWPFLGKGDHTPTAGRWQGARMCPDWGRGSDSGCRAADSDQGCLPYHQPSPDPCTLCYLKHCNQPLAIGSGKQKQEYEEASQHFGSSCVKLTVRESVNPHSYSAYATTASR